MDQSHTNALSVYELVTYITNTLQCADITCINYMKCLRKLCCPNVHSLNDMKLLKQFMSFLLSGPLEAVQNDDTSDLHTVKWQLLTSLLATESGVDFVATDIDLQSVLSLMLVDRFVSSNVLTAMAQWLVQLTELLYDSCACNVLDIQLKSDEEEGTYIDLIKQMYVTLENISLRQNLAKILEKIVVTKEQAKELVNAGMLRALLQVGLEHHDDVMNAVLLQNFYRVGTQVASLVCFEAAALKLSTKNNVEDKNALVVEQRNVCELVVVLVLSGSSFVVAHAVRMMQLLVDNDPYRSLLPMVPDLRGALEKAQALARLKSSKLLHDEHLKELCNVQYELLGPRIDAFEHKNGSVLGLLSNDETALGDEDAGKHGLELAMTYKLRGNEFFRRGNFPTACTFYRRATAVLKAAQLKVETSLQCLSVDELLTRCTIGASVQVRLPRSNDWQDAMVSDVNENDKFSQVEVLYDADDHEDEWVGISRIRLRMNTAVLTAFNDVAVDCFMNMGKACSALGDHDEAVQCFTHALSLRGGKSISALYSRGVANMARRDLAAAQQDLWDANQYCRMQQNHSASGGASVTNTRDTNQSRAFHKQIAVAYKKLQQMHANKKRLDKKVVKQMVKYLATVPGLQDE